MVCNTQPQTQQSPAVTQQDVSVTLTVTFVHTSFYYLLGFKQLSGLQSGDDRVWEWLRPQGAEHLSLSLSLFFNPAYHCVSACSVCLRNLAMQMRYLPLPPSNKTVSQSELAVKALILSEEI